MFPQVMKDLGHAPPPGPLPGEVREGRKRIRSLESFCLSDSTDRSPR